MRAPKGPLPQRWNVINVPAQSPKLFPNDGAFHSLKTRLKVNEKSHFTRNNYHHNT